MPRPSKGEECLADALAEQPLPGWDLTREFLFDRGRKWRFDFAFPSQKLAIEVDGRYHRTYRGQRNDSEKFNEATRQGWRVLRLTADRTTPPKAREFVRLVWEVLCCPPSTALDSGE